MAEKYGTVPPKYTAKWWQYIWDYYKWHIIITVVALLVASVTIVQCATRPKYDMNVVYAGHKNYTEREAEDIENLVAQYITDIDGNGENSVLFQPLVFMDSNGSAEYDYAVQTKLDMTFLDDCSFIYLMDKEQAQIYLQRDSIQDSFEDVSKWAGETSAEVLKAENGTGYAVSLADSALFKEKNIYCDDLYIMVSRNYKDDEANIKAHEDSLNAAAMLIK